MSINFFLYTGFRYPRSTGSASSMVLQFIVTEVENLTIRTLRKFAKLYLLRERIWIPSINLWINKSIGSERTFDGARNSTRKTGHNLHDFVASETINDALIWVPFFTCFACEFCTTDLNSEPQNHFTSLFIMFGYSCFGLNEIRSIVWKRTSKQQ